MDHAFSGVRAAADPVQPSRLAEGQRALRRAPPLLEPALACLAAHPIGLDRLLAARAEATRLHVSPERVLIAEGWIGEEEYARALARWLGVSFAGGDDIPAAGLVYPQSVVAGVAQGAEDCGGPRWIVAPEGPRIAQLAALRRRGELRARVALTTRTALREATLGAHAQTVAARAAGDLAARDPALSAATPATRGERIVLFAAGVLIAASLLQPDVRLAIALALAALFAGSIALRLEATIASATPEPTPPPLADARLPVYTIVAPLHREAEVAGKLVAALDALDYPRALLQIMLVVEEDDHETREALARLALPARYEIVVAPPGAPRTKPRALDVALPLARGALLVIYDAEDEPEPDQLRKAAAAFAAAPSRVGCLQARLAIDNTADGWLPKLFAAEYAALFDVLNPGFANLDLPLPLGGTSNHFRTKILRAVGGWDAWNVTEDADLGLRLARCGWAVRALESATWEEAPRTLGVWMGQRRRWFKGWMQTLVVHARQPRRLLRELGARRAAAALFVIVGSLLGPMLGPFFAAVTIRDAIAGDLLSPQGWASTGAATLWCCVWIAGAVSALWPIFLGLKRRGMLDLTPWLLLLPAYWLLLTIAAWRALFDYLRAPFHWAKTQHGQAVSSRRGRPALRESQASGR